MARQGHLNRRTVLAGSAAAAVALLAPSFPRAALARTSLGGGTTTLRLPAPTGPYPVGTVARHLVDAVRPDPIAPTPRARELMVTLWYPARQSARPHAPYLSGTLSALLVRQVNALIGASYTDDLLTFATHARRGAPPAPGEHPLVLFSPGLNTNAAFYTGLLEELASRGYVVAAVDHTFDILVEFPDGRVEAPRDDLTIDDLLPVRVDDVRFVLDRVLAHPETRTERVAALGHSLGTMTAIGAIDRDPRFGAGIALDGNPLGPAALGVPFLMLGNPSHRRADDPDWAAFYDRLQGPRLHLVVEGVGHNDLTDLTVFKEAIDLGDVFDLGSIGGRRSMLITRSYVAAWLDFALRGRGSALLEREPRRFPEVDFQP